MAAAENNLLLGIFSICIFEKNANRKYSILYNLLDYSQKIEFINQPITYISSLVDSSVKLGGEGVGFVIHL